MIYHHHTDHRRSICLKTTIIRGPVLILLPSALTRKNKSRLTYDKKSLFGKIKNGVMIVNKFGEISQNEWSKSAEIRDEIELDLFVVMPNHIHGIVIIEHESNHVGANGCSPLPSIDGSTINSTKGLSHISTNFSSITFPNGINQSNINIGENGHSPIQNFHLLSLSC